MGDPKREAIAERKSLTRGMLGGWDGEVKGSGGGELALRGRRGLGGQLRGRGGGSRESEGSDVVG